MSSTRKALAEVAQRTLATLEAPFPREEVSLEDVETLARAALAQPEPEPVAFMWCHDETGRIGFVDAWQLENGWREQNPRLHVTTPLYAAPPPPAQPAPCKDEAECINMPWCRIKGLCLKAEPAPEQHALSDESIKVWCETCEGSGQTFQEAQKGQDTHSPGYVGTLTECTKCSGKGYTLRGTP